MIIVTWHYTSRSNSVHLSFALSFMTACIVDWAGLKTQLVKTVYIELVY